MTRAPPIKQEEQPISLLSPTLYTTPSDSCLEEQTMIPWNFTFPCEIAAFNENPYRQEAKTLRATDGYAPPTANYVQSNIADYVQSDAHSYPSYRHSTYALPTNSHNDLRSTTPPLTRTHIPRPPNAFMLFRSDFLKKGIIPKSVERRQQNLSRVVGEVWNLAPPEEKAIWHKKAAEVLADHQRKNPDYKFSPAPRGSKRVKGKDRADNDYMDSERIRKIRETYANIPGPAATPSRRRRKTHTTKDRNSSDSGSHLSSSSSVRSSPMSLPSPAYIPSATNEFPSLPPPSIFPHYALPHIAMPRRPSTSLGFATSSDSMETKLAASRTRHNLTRPSSAASSDTGLSSFMRDLDITPTTANFKHISMPPTPSNHNMLDMFSSPYSTNNFSNGFCGSNSFLNGSYPELSSQLSSPSIGPTDTHVGGNQNNALLASLYQEASLPYFPQTQDSMDYSYIQSDFHPSPFDTSFLGDLYPDSMPAVTGNSDSSY
ncbi:hypothetical protein BDQ12DRAFT_709332 [Crucibulum laeve]|uniref:HMG box domain-containing protein n=1 Tax=Crucibulum laeve TaxID=68775 RepID=A0A5C3ME28_9AGAR|nr:hypothetical protein BDQ12DRAFT_709332 [Crucibulum laeve]